MEKYITDERTGLKYELAGDYYFLAGDNEPMKRRDQLGYVQRMNSIRSRATGIVNHDIIYN